MKSRGQRSFVGLPGIAARLYGRLANSKAIERQHQEIARDLSSRLKAGKILDVGTGPGRLLLEIHRLSPNIELHGLDISENMVRLARENMGSVQAKIECGDIRDTGYADNFFDLVTCTGSFYLWDNPEKCLEEIFRILKRGQSAFLFETHQDFDTGKEKDALKANLEGENIFRRLLTPMFLQKQLKMTYKTAEIAEIVQRTSFADSHSVEELSLGGLPVWLRITLVKRA